MEGMALLPRSRCHDCSRAEILECKVVRPCGRIKDVCGQCGGGLRSKRVAQNDLAFVELPVRDPLVVTAATRSTGLQVRSDLRDGPAPIIMSAVLRKLISKTGGNPVLNATDAFEPELEDLRGVLWFVA